MATRSKKTDDDRLMTLAELAKYLHLGRKTVLKLATSGKLPGVQIDDQWRFERDKISTWLQAQQTGSDVELGDVPDGMKVPLGDLLPDDAVIPDLRAKDALGVIEELAARAYSNRWLTDKPWFIGAVVERESLASTAMEGGVAFLHTRARDESKIARPFIIVGRSYNGIDFGAPDGKPTHMFFLLGLKYDRLHLPILGRLARAMKDFKTIAKLRSLPSTQKIRALLLKEDEKARTQTRSPVAYEKESPVLDRQQRLRAIMRRNAIRKHEEKKAEAAENKKKKAAAKKKKSAAKKKAATSSKKKAATAKKKAATSSKKKASAAKKKSATSSKKKASAAKKKTSASKKKKAASSSRKKASSKK